MAAGGSGAPRGEARQPALPSVGQRGRGSVGRWQEFRTHGGQPQRCVNFQALTHGDGSCVPQSQSTVLQERPDRAGQSPPGSWPPPFPRAAPCTDWPYFRRFSICRRTRVWQEKKSEHSKAAWMLRLLSQERTPEADRSKCLASDDKDAPENPRVDVSILWPPPANRAKAGPWPAGLGPILEKSWQI